MHSRERMTRKPLQSQSSFSHQPDRLDLIARSEDDLRRMPAADVTPNPAPPLDEMPVPPLTDPSDTKGG